MQFYFIRHAQSENNKLWRDTGSGEGRSEDPGITETGQLQAQHLARFLSHTRPEIDTGGRDSQNVEGFGMTHLYCSLMVRSVATGTVVAEALGVPLMAWPDIHESGGIYVKDPETEEYIGQPGKPRSYFETHYPRLGLPDGLDETGWWNRPFEESEERPRRARRFLEELLARHGGTEDRVAVISHAGFYNHVLRAILDLPEARTTPWFIMNNAAISRIDFREDHTRVTYTNRLDYLPRELVT
jgi:2,3-bisphosphoglycerate-dependent phosphoglycerate mutase